MARQMCTLPCRTSTGSMGHSPHAVLTFGEAWTCFWLVPHKLRDS